MTHNSITSLRKYLTHLITPLTAMNASSNNNPQMQTCTMVDKKVSRTNVGGHRLPTLPPDLQRLIFFIRLNEDAYKGRTLYLQDVVAAEFKKRKDKYSTWQDSYPRLRADDLDLSEMNGTSGERVYFWKHVPRYGHPALGFRIFTPSYWQGAPAIFSAPGLGGEHTVTDGTGLDFLRWTWDGIQLLLSYDDGEKSMRNVYKHLLYVNEAQLHWELLETTFDDEGEYDPNPTTDQWELYDDEEAWDMVPIDQPERARAIPMKLLEMIEMDPGIIAMFYKSIVLEEGKVVGTEWLRLKIEEDYIKLWNNIYQRPEFGPLTNTAMKE